MVLDQSISRYLSIQSEIVPETLLLDVRLPLGKIRNTVPQRIDMYFIEFILYKIALEIGKCLGLWCKLKTLSKTRACLSKSCCRCYFPTNCTLPVIAKFYSFTLHQWHAPKLS